MMSQSKQSFADYDGFVDKFKPKKTTDDCYTPPEVMEVVNAYVEKRWGLDRSRFVRPFFPGGDYENADYPDGCVVVDNPPFSMLARIKRFYLERRIPFFLFCPSLTAFNSWDERCDVIVCDAFITYENGANVRTAFVTSLPTDCVAENEPTLGSEISRVSDVLGKRGKKKLPKYIYPDSVLTAARLQWLASHQTELKVRRGECCKIDSLDAQRAEGKAIFGGGLLLSERAAAERAAAECAAAERAAAERWQLSDRERRMQQMLG